MFWRGASTAPTLPPHQKTAARPFIECTCAFALPFLFCVAECALLLFFIALFIRLWRGACALSSEPAAPDRTHEKKYRSEQNTRLPLVAVPAFHASAGQKIGAFVFIRKKKERYQIGFTGHVCGGRDPKEKARRTDGSETFDIMMRWRHCRAHKAPGDSRRPGAGGRRGG